MSDEMDKREQPWPAEEPPPDDEEREQAARLAGELDRLLAGETCDDAGGDVAAAVMLRAAEGKEPGLAPDALEALLDSATAQGDGFQRRRRRLRRLVPMAAMAATVMLVVSGLLLAPAMMRVDEAAPAAAPETLSRSGDDLLGRPISRTQRGAATARLDRLYADRMRGYRKVALAMGGPR